MGRIDFARLPVAERIMALAIVVSLVLHIVMSIVVLLQDRAPPPSMQEYSEWVKRMVPPRTATVWNPLPAKSGTTPTQEEPSEKKAPDQDGGVKSPSAQSETPSKSTPAAPSGAAPSSAKREKLRAALKGSGMLGAIGMSNDSSAGIGDVFKRDSDSGAGLRGVLSEGGRGKGEAGAGGGDKGGEGLQRQNFSEQFGSGKIADIGDVKVRGGGSAKVDATKATAQVTPFGESASVESRGGQIDKVGVRQTIARRNPGIQQCYERALKSANSGAGKIVLLLMIDATGRVTDVQIKEDKLHLQDVIDCVIAILKRTRFPKAEGGVVSVAVPFVFQPSE